MRAFLMVMVLVSLVGCGISKADYNAVVAERDQLRGRVTALEKAQAAFEQEKAAAGKMTSQLQVRFNEVNQAYEQLKSDYAALERATARADA